MNKLEIDIKYSSFNCIKEQFFIFDSNSNISVCNFIHGWGDLKKYETDDARTLLKHILQCVKESMNFKGFGIPQEVKIQIEEVKK